MQTQLLKQFSGFKQNIHKFNKNSAKVFLGKLFDYNSNMFSILQKFNPNFLKLAIFTIQNLQIKCNNVHCPYAIMYIEYAQWLID